MILWKYNLLKKVKVCVLLMYDSGRCLFVLFVLLMFVVLLLGCGGDGFFVILDFMIVVIVDGVV